MPRPFHVEYQPRLLVSVRTAAEASAALAGGADIIDVLPTNGGGPAEVDPTAMSAVIAAVGGQRPVSASLGNLTPRPGPRRGPLKRAASLAPKPNGLTFVRLGLAHAAPDWPHQLEAALAPWRPARALVVVYVDAARVAAPPLDELFVWAAAHNAVGLFIDTAIKDDKALFSWIDRDTLREVVMQARHRSMLVAVAGGLAAESAVSGRAKMDDNSTLAAAVQVAPDIIAVHRAAREPGGSGAVIQERVAELRKLIAQTTVNAAVRL